MTGRGVLFTGIPAAEPRPRRNYESNRFGYYRDQGKVVPFAVICVTFPNGAMHVKPPFCGLQGWFSSGCSG